MIQIKSWEREWTDSVSLFEPIHVHIAKGKPSENATKVRIINAGKYKADRLKIAGST